MDIDVIERFIDGDTTDVKDSPFCIREWQNKSRTLYYKGKQLVNFEPKLATLTLYTTTNVFNHLNDLLCQFYCRNIFTRYYIFEYEKPLLHFSMVACDEDVVIRDNMKVVFINVPSFMILNDEYCTTLYYSVKSKELNFTDVLGV